MSGSTTSPPANGAPFGPPPPPFLVYAVYLLATGQIVGQTTCAPGMATAASAALGEIAGVLDPGTQYIDTSKAPPAAAPRPACAVSASGTAVAADGSTSVTLSAIPAGSALTIDGGPPQTIGDGEVVFSATVAGTYSLVLAPPFPSLAGTFSVVAA